MELLLFALAIVFGVFSALMERRKRRRRLEEAQQQHAEIEQQHVEINPAAPVVVEEEKEEEPSFGWPFDGDPFEESVPAEVDPAEAEREALEAERQAVEAERRAVAAEKRAMERLTETKPEDAGEERRPRRTRSRWFLNPQTARDAIVYMEILGKPKSEREEW
jgi:flagellar biosynthesis/type III secretory pathway M-ring protein FliF/YscJ